MVKVQKVKLGNQEVDAIELDFEIRREEWNEYTLLDGGRVRGKLSVAKIFRILDAEGKPAYGPDGDPQMIVRHKVEVVSSE